MATDTSVWTCAHCLAVLGDTDALICSECEAPRYASWAIQLAEHVLEHLADGLSEPLEVLRAMQARRCYKRFTGLTLALMAQQMRLLTRDTTAIARSLAKARASRMMLEVCETGDLKDKIAVLKGIQVLGDVVTHQGEVTQRVVYELHDTAPVAATEEPAV